MKTVTYKEKYVYLDTDNLGLFDEIIINDIEARLYRDDGLFRVIQFDTMYEEENKLVFITDEKTDYYTHNNIEAMEIIETVMKYFGNDIDGMEAFMIGNILKYLLRFKYKDSVKSNMDKISDYCQKLNVYNEIKVVDSLWKDI